MDDTALGFFNSSSQGLGDTLLPERGDSQPPSQQGELEGDNLLNQPHKVRGREVEIWGVRHMGRGHVLVGGIVACGGFDLLLVI